MTRLWWLLLGCMVLAGCRTSGPNPPAASYRAQDFNVVVKGSSENVKGAVVSDAFFSAGKVQPVMGRAILPADNGSMRVAVISYRFWNDKFHADTAAIESAMQVNGQDVIIVGIMPKDFAFPDGAQLWVPGTLR